MGGDLGVPSLRNIQPPRGSPVSAAFSHSGAPAWEDSEAAGVYLLTGNNTDRKKPMYLPSRSDHSVPGWVVTGGPCFGRRSAGNLNCGSRYDSAGATPPFFALCVPHFRVGTFQLHRKKVPADSPLPQPVAVEFIFFPSVLKQDTQCPAVGL